MAEGPTTNVGKCSLGMDANVAALLSYTLGLVTGLVFFLLEKDSKFVKFHAMQSIGASIAWCILSVVLGFVPVIGWGLLPFANLAGIAIWVVCMVKAYQGQTFKLPVIGEIAAQQSGGAPPS